MMHAQSDQRTESNRPHAVPAPNFSVLDMLRSVYITSGGLFRQTRLQGELLKLEWAEEKNRLLQMLLSLLIGLTFLICALGCLSVLVMALFWDSPYRIPALLLLIGMHTLGLVLAWRRFQALSARSTNAFAATREELAADIALFGGRS